MKFPSHLSVSLALLTVALFAGACESEETTSGEDLQITPSYKEIGPGKSVALTASGANNYTWSLETAGLGGLSATKGQTVVYTAPSSLSANASQTITVVGTFDTSLPANLTNGTSSATAQATISIVVKEEKENVRTAVAISPASASVAPGSSVALSASGGNDRSYKWTLGNGSIGTLSSTTGRQVAYTARANTYGKTQTITVVSGGESGVCVVTHGQTQAETVTATASKTSLKANTSCILSATGGDGASYTWELLEPKQGVLSQPTGPKTTFTATHGSPGEQKVKVTSGGRYDILILSLE